MASSESREDWIVRETRKRPLAERSTFLDGACAGDGALRNRLEAVLVAPDPSESTLSQETEVARPTLRIDVADTPTEAQGQTIGRYKVLQKIGEGGCGVVYVAEQTEPVRRRVALKVIKLGMDTKAVVARFEAERQALALMEQSPRRVSEAFERPSQLYDAWGKSAQATERREKLSELRQGAKAMENKVQGP